LPVRVLIFISFVLTTYAADVCDIKPLEGSYGFQQSGRTAISGESKPVTSLGRITFNAEGAISGYSTIMFAGFRLGNPVTGQSEIHVDCTVAWSLQDDSGAFQHFNGVITPDRKSMRFRQTDVGGSVNGVMARTAERCTAKDFQRKYEFTLSGSFTPMLEGEVPRSVDATGMIQSDDSGNFTLVTQIPPATSKDIKVSVEDDCIVNIELALPAKTGKTTQLVTLRGILVNEGKEVLAIRTDPGWMASTRLTAR